jgi:hypothetical protein
MTLNRRILVVSGPNCSECPREGFYSGLQQIVAGHTYFRFGIPFVVGTQNARFSRNFA